MLSPTDNLTLICVTFVVYDFSVIKLSKFPNFFQQNRILAEVNIFKLSLAMKVSKFFYFLFFYFLSFVLTAQENKMDTLRVVYAVYTKLIKSGHLLDAANCLSGLLKPNIQKSEKELLAINNNLGIVYKNLGQYELALKFYDAAEAIFLNNS